MISVVVKCGPVVLSPLEASAWELPFPQLCQLQPVRHPDPSFSSRQPLSDPGLAPLHPSHVAVSNAISAFATRRHQAVPFSPKLTSAQRNLSTFSIQKLVMNLIRHSIILCSGYQPQYAFRKTISTFHCTNAQSFFGQIMSS